MIIYYSFILLSTQFLKPRKRSKLTYATRIMFRIYWHQRMRLRRIDERKITLNVSQPLLSQRNYTNLT